VGSVPFGSGDLLRTYCRRSDWMARDVDLRFGDDAVLLRRDDLPRNQIMRLGSKATRGARRSWRPPGMILLVDEEFTADALVRCNWKYCPRMSLKKLKFDPWRPNDEEELP